ncbi:MAG: DUF2309 domain-containing protein [Planctomycetia bacterium]|nr:DUF2309 domain-containing protein [Planctomycetia bacterium]
MTARAASSAAAHGEEGAWLSRLRDAIDHGAHLLPAQGPIPVFIHHNTLHAFEDLPFTQAVEEAARRYGCQPYLAEERYREELERGRIRFAGLEAMLRDDLGDAADERLPPRCTRFELRLAMLQHPVRFGPTEELLWFVAETDALRHVRPATPPATRLRLIAETRRWVMRDLRGGHEAGHNGGATAGQRAAAGLSGLLERFGEARIEGWTPEQWEAFALQSLWRVCCDGAATVPECTAAPALPTRHRDLLLQTTGIDTDLRVHEVLHPYCAAFLDQGLAAWQLPLWSEGFYRAFSALYRLPGGPPDSWRWGLASELRRMEAARVGPLESIRESLDLLGVAEEEWDDYLAATLLALRGWAGMIRFLEERPDRAVHPPPPGSLVEFLAVRLVLERLALQAAARDHLGYSGPLTALRDELRKRLGTPRPHSVEQRAFLVFQLAQVLGWTPPDLHRLSEREWHTLVREIEAFSALERRRIFHLAYEGRFRFQSLDALALHAPDAETEPRTPRFQVMFCIDEREESFRRHVEELAPDAETFGIAGFYFVPMYFRGAADAHFVPLCPVVIRPRHWVVERADGCQEGAHGRRARTRRVLGRTMHQLHVGSRTFAFGALLSAVFGVLASVPLIVRTLFPRLMARLRSTCGRIILDPPATRLQLERTEAPPGSGHGPIGFTLDELTDIGERVLRDTGLTRNFARLVLTLGHGSSSINNPHESAYDCGACGGSRGGPNGRAVAQILNDPLVRQRLAARGLRIPDETVFVGGWHNTSNELVTFFDLDLLPDSHAAEFAAARGILERARERNAHERCRRFMSARLTLSFAEALQHVEGRAEDLAQVRPELGHATNALCIVGRRCRTRGLFLDRRAFLNSYDPTQDDADGAILTRILLAALPVCAGISLEYYFSTVDSPGLGCGSKLPHNITALLGVMDGAASDLRTGLPWQMVEIHEPVRILFVVETTPDIMLRILERNPGLDQLVRNQWVQLAVLDPHSSTVRLYRDGVFRDYRPQAQQLPRAQSSVDWYRGWRDHLEFAVIDPRAVPAG